MLPERLSTDLTSLNPDVDRLAVVVEMDVARRWRRAVHADFYRARVHNRAKLAYNGVAAWLDGDGAMPAALADVAGLADNLRLQDQAAQRLRQRRRLHGALSLETIRARPVFDDDDIRDLDVDRKNRATELIEDFMIAANGVTARFLVGKHSPMIRRVVRAPKRWDRIVELARTTATALPAARLGGAGRVPGEGQSHRSRAVPRPVARGDQAARRGRVRGRAAGCAGSPDTSAWPSRTTRTPPRRTGATPTWSPSDC